MMRKEGMNWENGAVSAHTTGRPLPFSFLLFALLISPALFAAAAWQPAVFSALILNALVLALFLAAITLLRLEQLRHMLYDEFGQMAITVLIAILLIGGMGEAENIASAFGFAFGSQNCAGFGGNSYPYCATIPAGSSAPPAKLMPWAKDVSQKHLDLLNTQMQNGLVFNAKLGAASSVSGFCNLLGVGVSVAGCTAYGTMRGPTGQMLTALGTGIMEAKAEQFLLSVADTYALTLLVPLGIIMRCLHFTRKAGGTIIAIGLTLYLVLPTSIILTQALCDRFLAENTYSNLRFSSDPFPQLATPNLNAGVPDVNDMECDPFEPDEGKLVSNSDSRVNTLINSNGDGSIEQGASPTEQIIFLVIARTLLMGALIVTMMIMSIRTLGHALGSEVDVYALARLS